MTVPKKVEEGKPRFRWGIPLFSTLCAAILVFMVYALTHRYTLATSSDGAVYQTDRLTGKTWKVEGATMKEVVEATPTPAPDAAKELRKLILISWTARATASISTGTGVLRRA